MPTEWEQDVAEMYVMQRKLSRPNTSVKKVAGLVLLFVLITSLFVWIAHYVFAEVGIFVSLPIVLLGVFLIGSIFCFKDAIIGSIRLYQRYAPEEIRRRCLFMPTCSEYAIMAVKKYGGIIGLCKTYRRLMFLCRGNIYRIDYP
jgi:hypothetical protein